MDILRSAERLVMCLPLLFGACVLDRSAVATDCSEGVPCRLHEFGEDTPADASQDASSAHEGDSAEPQSDAEQPILQADASPLLNERDAAIADAGPSDPNAADAATLELAAVPSELPRPSSGCPEFVEGSVRFGGSRVRLWVGSDGESKRGPLVFYWYSSGSSSEEALVGLGASAIAEIKRLGGAVAALEESTGAGTSTGTSSWYTGDYAVADQVVACAVAKGVGIDTSHIHAVGFGAGGLQSSWMAYARSNYLASVVSYSGGLTNSWRTNSVTEDATNVVPAMLVHGRPGLDRFLYDYAATSSAMASDIVEKGGTALVCEHAQGHVIPEGIGSSALRFLLDHPYKKSPSAYRAAIPEGFPSYCKLR